MPDLIRQIAFQRKHLDRLQSRCDVLESRNKLLRAEVERLTHGEQPQWTEFQAVDTCVFGDGRIVDGKGTDPTGKFMVLVNSRYQVTVYRAAGPDGEAGDYYHLSIKRIDGAAIRDWRDMQRIKNEVIGPEHEGVELYPAESRLTDGANQYHLSVLANAEYRFPFGFGQRLVSENEDGGVQQRPFDADQRPDDLQNVSMAQMAAFAGLDP